ncbi:hypothetical protein JTE90_014295 [Oedothorax gibbosus]|uniref:Uncharacterized protein n=1 Tax=Oedothorax gibbosus TaxID=931172 RepID=A0AAV6UK75_9ARAC|nr:hypothetical protein JTE90_014295 [Oedothorax gibbosus]
MKFHIKRKTKSFQGDKLSPTRAPHLNSTPPNYGNPASIHSPKFIPDPGLVRSRIAPGREKGSCATAPHFHTICATVRDHA